MIQFFQTKQCGTMAQVSRFATFSAINNFRSPQLRCLIEICTVIEAIFFIYIQNTKSEAGMSNRRWWNISTGKRKSNSYSKLEVHKSIVFLLKRYSSNFSFHVNTNIRPYGIRRAMREGEVYFCSSPCRMRIHVIHSGIF